MSLMPSRADIAPALLAAGSIAAIGGLGWWLRASKEGSAPKNKLRFGVIADIQYADIDNKGPRNYRGTLKLLEDAIAYFNANAAREPLAFIVHLGDIVDDVNSKQDDGETTTAALNAVMSRFEHLKGPQIMDTNVKFLIGNHEMYNFTRKQLQEGVETNHGIFKCADGAGNSYYSWCPNRNWRMIVLDPYIESIHAGGRRSGLDAKWTCFICERNKNVRKQMEEHGDEARAKEAIQCNYFADLEGLDRRWAPFNGGLGEEQREWLKDQLKEASASGQRVVTMCHVLFHPEATRSPAQNTDACYGKTLVWDFEEVLAILQSKEASCVVACLHGHQHEGGFHTDEFGIHHVVFESPLMGPAHAVMEFDEKFLTLRGCNIDQGNSRVFPDRQQECHRKLALRCTERHLGTIKSFAPENGFGFIQCGEIAATYGHDVFLNEIDLGEFAVGAHVSFDVAFDNQGMPQARDLQPA